MSEVLEANIFFFITSIAVIVFTLLLCILLYHLIKILKTVRRVIERIEAGSEIIAGDMMHFRKFFAEQSFLSSLIGAFFGRANGRTTKKSARRKKSAERAKTTLAIKDED